MWVFCCGMRRSGSTLQYQLTANIVESRGIGRALGWVEPQQFPQLRASHIGEKGLLVVKCHTYVREAAELFSRREAKAIYVHRDIRDVVVSMMNKNRISFWQVVQSGFVGQVLEEYSDWSKVGDILVSRYEVMIADLRWEVLRIADYLGVDLDESSASQIAERHTIDQQVQRIQSFDYENLGIRVGTSAYDPVSLLHKNHIHSAQVEQWRAVLSCFQIGLIEDMVHRWLVDRGYPISQNWVMRKASAIGYLFDRFANTLRGFG